MSPGTAPLVRPLPVAGDCAGDAARSGGRRPAAGLPDSKCEVVVSRKSTIELPRSSGLYAVAVYEVKGDEVGLFFSVRDGGGITFSCDGDDRCDVSVRSGTGQLPPSARIDAHPGTVVQVAKVKLEVIAVAGGRAVVRLTAAK